jgi:hypothetical protein
VSRAHLSVKSAFDVYATSSRATPSVRAVRNPVNESLNGRPPDAEPPARRSNHGRRRRARSFSNLRRTYARSSTSRKSV